MPLFSSQRSPQRVQQRPQQGSQQPRRANFAQAPAPAPQPAGTAASALLKRYRPLETRAAGGFGSVEICLDGRLQRRVAIKRMPLASPYTRATAETTRTALAEARTASMLQHPNIVSVIDFTYDAGYAYLVMEYVDGMSLEEFLSQVEGNSLTYDEAACIADALVQAVAYAHENGVLHLDIKPANVLIDRSGHVKITDFGMATLTSAAGFGGARGGTIGYMPPEQLRGDYVDERSDIFSLACVLYESLCGDAPFRAGSPIDSMTRINEGVVLPGTLLPDLPELAEQALLSALDPDPAMRISSVLDFGDRFLYNLGNPREGRKSLARMIDQLTSDEEESQDEDSLTTRRTWELDPAEGHLGSRDPRARRIAMGLVAGASVAAVTFSLMQTVGVANPLACLLSALAVGAAAGAAPQMGSALALAGLVFTVTSATASLAGIPTIVLIFALAAAWWLVWGRTVPAASMALAACMALSVVASSPSALAPVAAAAGYFLSPVTAAVSIALGTAFSALMLAASQGAGQLPIDVAFAALASPDTLMAIAGAAALSAGISLAHRLAWNRYQDSLGTGAFALAYALPLAVSPALLCLAHPMEIASLSTAQVLTAGASGGLSSIIVWICAYTLGYKHVPEGDRS